MRWLLTNADLIGMLCVPIVTLLPWVFSPSGGITTDHTIHWMAANQWVDSWQSSDFWPHYQANVNGGRGSFWPLYYPPLYHIGCAIGLTLGLDYWRAAWVVVTLAHCTGVLLCYGWLRHHVARYPALVGSVAFCFAPYALAEVYHRGAFPEAIAMQFFPGVLWGIDAFRTKWNSPAVLLGICSFALMTFCHFPSVVISLYAVGVYLAAGAIVQRSPRQLLGLSVPLLGFALGAQSWAPFALDEHLVQVPPSEILSHPRAIHFVPLFSVHFSPFNIFEFFGWTLLLTAGLLAWSAYPIAEREKPYWIGAICLVITGTLLCSEGFFWAWRILPMLGRLQFPWRTLCMVAPGLALLAAYAGFHPKRVPLPAFVCGIIWCTFLAFAYLQRELPPGVGLPTHGNEVNTAYVPAGVPLPQDSDPALPEVFPTSGQFEFQVTTRKPERRVIQTVAREPFSFLLCIFADPRWKAYDQDGQPLRIEPSPTDRWGRLQIHAPANTMQVTVALELGRSIWIGRIISAATLSILLLVCLATYLRGPVGGRPIVKDYNSGARD